jgi:hypothetical protein
MKIFPLSRHGHREILYLTELDAVAFLIQLAGKFSVKEPKENFTGLTWTAGDVGGPRVEAPGMISENSSSHEQGTPVT